TPARSFGRAGASPGVVWRALGPVLDPRHHFRPPIVALPPADADTNAVGRWVGFQGIAGLGGARAEHAAGHEPGKPDGLSNPYGGQVDADVLAHAAWAHPPAAGDSAARGGFSLAVLKRGLG